jgi:putative ABC transport system permease protein
MAFLQDLRHSLRSLRRNPGFTVVAVGTLSLTLGATVSVFSVLEGVLLRPLSYREPDRLVSVYYSTTTRDKVPGLVKDLVDYDEQATLFEGFAGRFSAFFAVLTDFPEPDRVYLSVVTPDLFTLLGARPLLGRAIDESDGEPLPWTEGDTVPPTEVIVLSQNYWETRFGADPEIIGRIIHLNGRPAEVVGVMPREFTLLLPEDVGRTRELDAWTPLRIDLTGRLGPGVFLIGRLRPGVTVEQAQAELQAIASRQRADTPLYEQTRRTPVLYRFHEDGTAHVRAGLTFLTGAVMLLLLLASANVAGLVLIRARGRGRDFAVRLALGGERRHLVRRLLVESALVAAAAWGIGMLLARVGLDVFMRFRPERMPLLDRVGFDPAVLGFAALATLVATFLFGLLPAFRATRVSVTRTLNDQTRTAGGMRRVTVLSGLVVLEVAIAMVVLTGVGLLLGSAAALQRVDPGFEADRVLTFRVHMWGERFQDVPPWVAYRDALADRLRELPGVEAVADAWPVPMYGNRNTFTYLSDTDGTEREARGRYSAPGYFDVMGTPLLAGRDFLREEMGPDSDGVIIDEVVAGVRWPGASPSEVVGRTLDLRWGEEIEPARVVGVSGSSMSYNLGEELVGTIHVPARPWQLLQTLVRTSGAPDALIPEVRRITRELDPTLPVYDVVPMQAWVDRTLGPARFVLALTSTFGVLTVLLTAVGLYGTVAYAVSQRRPEIGIRMALGADRGAILRMILAEGGGLTCLGIVLGILASVTIRGGIAPLLYGGAAIHVSAAFLTVVGLSVVALAACLVPARSACTTDPLVSVRMQSALPTH